MQNTPTDRNLLRAFVATHDERAFSSLAERYSGLVFHTARRILNDDMLAEDVAQRVLSALARKAKRLVQSEAPLPAWLHRATVLEARTIRRTEARHHRKKEALMHASNDPTHSGDPAWREALPHLDDAIDKLSETDLNVLFLHFLNGLTFPEIAVQIGKSAPAVQKQSRRALSKLQQLLGKRGTVLTIGTITLGLGTEIAKAAPPQIVTKLASATVATGTTAIVVNITLIAISVTVLVCGVPLGLQHREIRALESRLQNAPPVTLGITAARRAKPLQPTPPFPALRSGPTAIPGVARQKQIPSNIPLGDGRTLVIDDT
jgi:RNA polymerase sigma-70 factor (ECF subfamily)